MSFTGLAWTTLWPLAAASAIVVVAAYLLRDRRRTLTVAFVPLWANVVRDRESSRWWSRLRHFVSLLLQLLLVFLLLAALSDPRRRVDRQSLHHYAVLVDVSASMQATDLEPSRLSVAEQQLHRWIDQIGDRDRVLMVAIGRDATPMLPFTSDRTALHAAVTRLAARDVAANWHLGLRRALELLRDRSRPELILVTDGAFDLGAAASGLDLTRIPIFAWRVGSGRKNVAITAFAARRVPLDRTSVEILLQVVNTDDVAHTVQARLSIDKTIIDTRQLQLGPGQQLAQYFEDPVSAGAELVATLHMADGSRDQLSADDRAFALLPERHRAKILVVTRGNAYLEAALLLDQSVDLTVISPGQALPEGKWDGAVLDAAPAPAGFHGPKLWLAPPKGEGPIELGRTLRGVGFDSWKRDDPLIARLVLADVQVAVGHSLIPGPGDEVIAKSVQGPLLVRGTRNREPFIALGFEPRDSDMVLRPAWPLLMLNALGSFFTEDTRYISSWVTGRPASIPCPAGVGFAEVTLPDKSQIRAGVTDEHLAFVPETAGVYRVHFPEAPEADTEIAVNLSDPVESRIQPATKLSLAGRTLLPPPLGSGSSGRPPWSALVLAVMALVLFEWLAFHRRWTT